jgi:hypothetical protein
VSVRVLPLMDYIPALSPRFTRPLHLAPLVEAFERTEREPVHAVVCVPPRHMKSETAKHGIARRLRKNPHTRIAYVRFKRALSEIRTLTAKSFPRVQQKVVDLCAGAGVAVAFVPDLPPRPWTAGLCRKSGDV